MKKWAKWFNNSFFLAMLSLLGVNYGYAFQQNLIGNDVLPDSAIIVISDTASIVGTSVTLDLNLFNPTGSPINSIQFSVEFDTAMVELEGFNLNEEFLDGFSYLTNDSLPGRVYFSAASAQDLLSNGQLAQISFQLNTIGKTQVQLNNLLLNEGNPPVSISGGQLIIEEEPDTIPPVPPANLQAALLNASTVKLNWTTGQDLDLKQYRMYERQGNLDPNWSEEDLQTPWLLKGVIIRDSLLVGTPAPLQAAMQIQLDGLANLERYHYWVTALDSTGNESLAERVNIRAGDTEIPDAPTLSSVSLSDREITVSWEASTSADVAGYVLYRSEEGVTLGLKQPESNSQLVTTSPGEVEWVVLNDWETENQRHRLFLDLRQFPEEVDPSTVSALQLFDVYDGPVTFDYVDDSWAYYFIPNQILTSTILASTEADQFRRADEFNMYGIKAELDFTSYTEEAPTFELVDIFTTEQLSYVDTQIKSRHHYQYRVAAFDSVNGDPSVTFDPEQRSEFSEFLSIETPAFAWKVNPTGQGDFEYIQDAIQASQAGDTILVDPGKYVEQLRIKHPLTLRATGDWGEVRLVKPPFVDTLITVTADSYTAGRWPQGQSLYLNGFDIWGIEEVATAGVGISMKTGTKTRLNRVHMTQFMEVFNTKAASYYASNSIFYENRRLGTHSNDLDPDASGADSVIYRHVNVLNTYDRVSSTEGAVAIEFRNSILADELELKLNDSRFQGAGVRFIDVAVDTNEVRTGVDMTQLPASEFEITGYIPSLVHVYTLDQVLFNRLFEWDNPADYRLRPQSKVIGQGRPIPELMKDFAGVSRHIASDKRVDLGAFEHPSDAPILFEAPFLEAKQIELPTMDPLGNANQAIELTLSVPDSMLSFLDALYLLKHDAQGQLMRVDTLQPGTFVDSEVEDGRGYVYTTQAVYYQIYESELSEEVSIFIKDITPPPAVQYLTATRLNTRIFEFSWEADTAEVLSGFQIYRTPSAGLNLQNFVDTVDTNWRWSAGLMSLDQLQSLEVERIDSVQVTQEEELNSADNDSLLNGFKFSYIDDDLQLLNRTSYTYWITAKDTSGNESDPRFIQLRTGDDIAPQPPTNLRQTILSGRIILQWHPSLDEDEDVERYRIYRGEDSLAVELYAEVEGNKGTFVDDSLDNILKVFYRVSAVDSAVGDPMFSFDPALESALSNSTTGYFVDLRGPEKPEILSVRSSNNEVEFNWRALPDIDLEYHRIYRGFHPDSVALFDTTASNNPRYLDQTVENGRTYFYYVSGVDTANNEGERSDVVLASPVNIPPVVSQYPDVYMHNQESDRFSLPFTFQAFDADGDVDSTLWLVNGLRYSSERVSEIPVQQGSTHITMIAVDDDGARDSASFAVYVDAGYTELANSLAPSTGLSLFGNDFVFQPDGKGNLSLMVRNELNEFSLNAPLRSPVAIASDSSFYLFSGTNNLRKYSLFNWWKHKITVPYWTVNTGGIHESSPIIDEQRSRIYAVSTDNQIYAINMRTGAQVWRSNIQASGIHPGVIIGNKYLAQPNILGDIVYFDLDGTITFKELSPIGKTVFADSLLGALAFGQNQELVAAFSSGKVRKWKPNFTPSVTSQTVWEVELGGSFTTTPVIAEDGMVLVGGADSTFYGLNGSTGQPEWSFKASDAITSTASINEYGVVYFGVRSGRFYALNSKGELLWDYQVPVEDSINNGGSGDSGGENGGESGANSQNKNQSILNTINYANGSVFFGTQGGKLVSIRDGWRYDGSLETEFGPEWERSFAQWATYQGNYRRSGSVENWSATSNEEFDALPTEFNLSQNYPNPFNPSTKIEFSIPEASDVRLEVFNMLGQKVQTLKNERMAAGYYSVVFEAGGLSSGVYVYQLTAREFSQTKRMLLVK